VLPTFLSASSVAASDVWISLSLFVLLYSSLAVVELMLMVRAVRDGPRARADRPRPAPETIVVTPQPLPAE
jgi:cytochrome d ubiquinol oxidase subunit I